MTRLERTSQVSENSSSPLSSTESWSRCPSGTSKAQGAGRAGSTAAPTRALHCALGLPVLTVTVCFFFVAGAACFVAGVACFVSFFLGSGLRLVVVFFSAVAVVSGSGELLSSSTRGTAAPAITTTMPITRPIQSRVRGFFSNGAGAGAGRGRGAAVGAWAGAGAGAGAALGLGSSAVLGTSLRSMAAVGWS